MSETEERTGFYAQNDNNCQGKSDQIIKKDRQQIDRQDQENSEISYKEINYRII